MTEVSTARPIVTAGAHVMMTVPNFYRIETGDCDLSHYDRLVETPVDNSGGRIHLGREPGLGITMNLDYLRANMVDGFGDPEAR